MNADYRNTELTNARKQLDAAQKRFKGMVRWTEAKRELAEQIEFWGNKVAFLSHAR